MDAQELRNLQEAYLDVYQLDEASPTNPNLYKGRHGQTVTQYQADRSDAGRRISGDDKTGPRYYTLGRSRGVSPDPTTQPGQNPVGTPKLADWEKNDIEYRRSNLKAGKTNKFGGPKGLPRGGSSSLPGIGGGSAGNNTVTGRYVPGAGGRFGISGIGLADSYDYYDIILSHLLDEGFASDEKSAEVIMGAMSEAWIGSIVEAIDMTKTDAYKNAQTKAATKFYTTPIKPLPPYQARTPRFPALTVPDFGLGTNKSKFPPVPRDDGGTERPVPPRTERSIPPRTERPVAPRQKGTESQKPKPQVTPAQPKPEATPYKGPGYKKDTSIQDMIDRSRQRQQAPKAEAPQSEAPRQPISAGAAGAEGVKFVERGSSAAAGSPAKPVRDQMTGLSPRERSQMKR